MKVLIVEPGYSPYEADLENTPAALTAVLESEQYTAAFPFDNTVIAAVYGGDAEKPYNRTLGSIGLVQGRFIVCGSRRGRFVGSRRSGIRGVCTFRKNLKKGTGGCTRCPATRK